MTPDFPHASPDRTAGDVRRGLEGHRFAEAGHVYLFGPDRKLVGQVPIERLLESDPRTTLETLQGTMPVIVHADDAAEAAALVAVTQHESDVAVTDEHDRLVGVVATPTLLALLHAEHVEDYLRAAGLEGSHPTPHDPYGVWRAYRARVRWLLVGLLGGIGAAFVVRFFEATIEAEIMLAAFMPLVVYLADAIGTQTEALVVRSLAVGRQRFSLQVLQEGSLGVLLGLSLGALALGALILFGIPIAVAWVVGLSILAASIIATLLATIVCWGAASIGADPAFASGPVATVLQDVVSVATYLLIASQLL